MRQIGICRAVRTCHSEPVRTLVWESPSNSRQPIVIQTVLFTPFSEVHLREILLLSGRLPHQSEDWFAMTGNSPNSQFICLLHKIDMHFIKDPGAICAPGSHILRQIQPVGDQIVSREVTHGTDCKPSEGSNHQSHRIAHGFQIYAKGQAC